MVKLGELNISESDFIFTPVEVVAKEILRELLVFQNTNRNLLSATNYLARYDNFRSETQAIIKEGWTYLKINGLIVHDFQRGGFWFFISRKGKEFKDEESWDIMEAERYLPRDIMSDSFKREVWPLFIRKQYDIAIFQAFKLLEVAVRDKSGLSDDSIGVVLMREAFKKNTGPLSNHEEKNSEQEALAHLYSGAIGRYKNPQSHRIVGEDNPVSAAEKIILANHLIGLMNL
jgi:uncharacterized protein (TIGR02391 family)